MDFSNAGVTRPLGTGVLRAHTQWKEKGVNRNIQGPVTGGARFQGVLSLYPFGVREGVGWILACWGLRGWNLAFWIGIGASQAGVLPLVASCA